jgi:limonene-1,2-epoxide hydrolase
MTVLLRQLFDRHDGVAPVSSGHEMRGMARDEGTWATVGMSSVTSLSRTLTLLRRIVQAVWGREVPRQIWRITWAHPWHPPM